MNKRTLRISIYILKIVLDDVGGKKKFYLCSMFGVWFSSV